MKLVSLSITFLCLALSGCASIVGGHHQSVSVVAKSDDVDVVGAHCSLTNDKGQWFATTPGSVTVRRSFAAMAVDCKNEQMAGTAQVNSSTKALAFGNILFGGVIGVGVDVATGAAYDYPDTIRIDLASGDPRAGANVILTPVVAAAPSVPVVNAKPADAAVPASPVAMAIPVVDDAKAAAPPRLLVAAAPVAVKGGQDSHNVRKLAQSLQCSDSASPVLVAKNPGSELYSVACTGGAVIAVQCDFGNCRALK